MRRVLLLFFFFSLLVGNRGCPVREKKQKIGGSVKEICLPNVTLTTIHLMISQLEGHQDGEGLKRDLARKERRRLKA